MIPADDAKIEIAAYISPVPPPAAAAADLALSAQVPQEAPSIVSPVQPGAPSPAISPSPEATTPRANSSGPEPRSEVSENAAKLLFLNAGESWFSAHKYILGSLVLVAVVIAVIAMMR
jgi:hypothetical protein